jgi:hypothetical protein
MSPEALAFSVAGEEIEQLWTASGCPLPGRSRRVQCDRARRSGTVAQDHEAIAVLPGRARRQGRAGPPSSRRDPAVGSAVPHATARRSTSRRSAVRLTGAASGTDGARPLLVGRDLHGRAALQFSAVQLRSARSAAAGHRFPGRSQRPLTSSQVGGGPASGSGDGVCRPSSSSPR